MRNLLLILTISFAALAAACSGDDTAPAAPAQNSSGQGSSTQGSSSQGSQDSSSLSINDDGFSYEEKSGGNSTSVNIGDDDDKKNK